jgi:hypothetical protein
MTGSELKAKLLAEIKPKGYFWRDSLMIDMLDYEYPIFSKHWRESEVVRDART